MRPFLLFSALSIYLALSTENAFGEIKELGDGNRIAEAGDKETKRMNESFTWRYLSVLLGGIDEARERLQQITAAADAPAARLHAGGELYIASVREDFVSEGFVRSGGLMLLKPYSSTIRLSEKDTVILGWTNSEPEKDMALAQELKKTGAYIVGIGPRPEDKHSKLFLSCVNSFLESSLPVPSEVIKAFGGERYPAVSLQNLVLLWTFTGELVGALTRKGIMPTMYQSVLVTGARERNARYLAHRFHEKHKVPPVPAGQLGRAYLKELEVCYRKLLDEEMNAIEEAARVCVRVRKGGHRIYAFLISHFPVHQWGAPGDPGYMHRLEVKSGETPTNAKLQQNLRQGDLFFFLGYYRRPTREYKTARHAGALVVEVITGTDEHKDSELVPDYRIRPKWPYGDSLVTVPGYDVKILPSSGIVQSVIYWAVVGSMSAKAPPNHEE